MPMRRDLRESTRTTLTLTFRRDSVRAGQNRLHQNSLEYSFVSTDTLTTPAQNSSDDTAGFGRLGVPESLVRVLAARDVAAAEIAPRRFDLLRHPGPVPGSTMPRIDGAWFRGTVDPGPSPG